ncbi:glycosyltransferase [Hydrogenophaga crocea]|uniref:Glycosyltransferase family 1 protein n=1 Tax=Hydrogenophaga crocea TaxID=2716225 RepID=A0A6G8IL81_9BURK|nr:glycosyltransferase [Hydrogenophaga crocea]QIM53982.1 glycosyltransferase family 1 protein [Hydrogenophaga crocea]
MRIFQNSGLYPAYRHRLEALRKHQRGYAEWMSAFLADRYGTAHYLQPVLQGAANAFFTNGDDESAQRLWAKEQGLPNGQSLEAILLAQIEHHRTEIFYNLDPMRYGSDFVRKLPGSVRLSFAWRAAPSPGADFSAYDLVLCNFPSILKSYADRGWRARYFSPAHDPAMDRFAMQSERPVDVVFVGGYSRHHSRRAALLEAVADLAGDFELRFHLDNSRMTRLAESPLGLLLPVKQHRRPRSIQSLALDPVFGLDLYAALGSAKIVLNGAIDMAGNDRGNMRCFEALGCGALMLSDAGNYPKGMCDGESMVTYSSPAEAVRHIRALLGDPLRLKRIADSGHHMVATAYSKAEQWKAFVQLAAAA